MNAGNTSRYPQGLNVLLIDSDPGYLDQCSESIAEDGHRVWAAQDLIAAANFLADKTPDLIIAELALLEIDGVDPLGEIRLRVPMAPVITASRGSPDKAFHTLAGLHDIYGYHDKNHGFAGLRLWVRAAHSSARHGAAVKRSRRQLWQVLESVPKLHALQKLDEVLEVILERARELTSGRKAFVAARMSDPVGKPPLEGLGDVAQTVDDYVVGAATGDDYPRGTTVDQLAHVPTHLVERAVEERRQVVQDGHGVLPLALAEHVLGLAYLSGPAAEEGDAELLQLFACQAAAAIRNAVLFELATVDATTRVFQKAFTLDRLRETLKLAWRRAFPVSVLMIDIDSFKEFNDTHGHVVGDRALRHFGRLLKANVRDSDIVGRFGGDEFLVILTDANDEGADIVAERLLQALARERGRPWPERMPPLKASMGMGTLIPGDLSPVEYGVPDFAEVIDALVHEADAAMYAARRETDRIIKGRTLTWADFSSA